MQSPVFVSAVYGEDYLPFATAYLHSVEESHPGARQVILWQDLPAHEIELLRTAFPAAKFDRIEGDITGTSDQKIPRKLHAWREACDAYGDSPLVFLDCDLLVLRPLDRFIPTDVDVVFTWKDDIFPLNTGVILIRPGDAARAFLDEWIAVTEALVTDAAKVKRIRRASGGGSQHTFREIVGWVNYDRVFSRTVRGHDVVFQGVPCAELNETRCVPMTEDTHIVHYKSGWHSLLLGRTGYTRTRPQEKCAEMYALWLRMEREASLRVAAQFVEKIQGSPGFTSPSPASAASKLSEACREALGARRVVRLESERGSRSESEKAESVADGERWDLPAAWLADLERIYRDPRSVKLCAEPATIRRLRDGSASGGDVFHIGTSVGSASPAALAWLISHGPLPRGIVVEGPLGTGVREALENSFLRVAGFGATPDGDGGCLILPQAKDARRLHEEHPAFAPPEAKAGWLRRVAQRVGGKGATE